MKVKEIQTKCVMQAIRLFLNLILLQHHNHTAFNDSRVRNKLVSEPRPEPNLACNKYEVFHG